MSLEFDPRCGFAQREDKIGDLLVPRQNGLTTPTPSQQSQSSSKQNAQPVVAPYVDVNFDDLYTDWDRYALNVPPGVVLLPGYIIYLACSCTQCSYM